MIILHNLGMVAHFLSVFVPTPTNPVDIGATTGTFGTMIGTFITTALPYAVGLFAAVVGWRYVRKFVH